MSLKSIYRYMGDRRDMPEGYPWVGQMVEEIEHEVGRDYMHLPVDTNLEPIRIGDVMEFVRRDGNDEPFEVIAIGRRGAFSDIYYNTEGKSFPAAVTKPTLIRHYKQPPTVEEVLREYAPRWMDTYNPEDKAALVNETADKVREAVRAE